MALENQWAYAVVASAVLFINGCASPATTKGMTVTAADLHTTARPEMSQSVSVGIVEGGVDTDPAWSSQISNPDFKAALVNSLRVAGLLSNAPDGRYVVKASLLELDQPALGLNMTVTSKVHYVVTSRPLRLPGRPLNALAERSRPLRLPGRSFDMRGSADKRFRGKLDMSVRACMFGMVPARKM